MRLVQESANLYRLTRVGMVNCFLLRKPDGLTLIDTNLPGSCRAILDAANSLDSHITVIALTHAHFDHVGSLDALAKALPNVKVLIGSREARLLARDFSLEPDEQGKSLLGFKRVESRPHSLLRDNDRIGSLRVIPSPGHTPGHVSFLDARDNSLIAGDSFTTQTGVVAAGVHSLLFPFPAWFSWNADLAAQSAASLCALRPDLLAVGHGPTVRSPWGKMQEAVETAFRQHPIHSPK